ncbi:SRPBCC family protein [Nonomuraea guangzhouensis]|uniref:SRPBCC domain-containing protein n=1 Tax=Nonomuraea guangzhouensis TaxID=1291555 RepID=A0ABW4GP41_9ACTN|nr:SRPBCC domain-containing protein [Nonomuraea guangzhouensis]
MGESFELPQEATVGASPEEVWAAIATGPGIDSWFMGRNEVADGVVRTVFGQYTPESTVTTSEPPARFAHTSPTAEDGRFVAFEFLVEGRDQGSTTLRMVASGFLPGDDWETEFEAMSLGLEMFFATLVAYLTHFSGRTATPVTEFGPPVAADWPRAWAVLYGELGIADHPKAGDPVRFTPAGLAPIDGVVYFANAQTLGVRTPDAIYRFLQGIGGSMVAAHHLYTGTGDQGPAWHAWLDRLFSA